MQLDGAQPSKNLSFPPSLSLFSLTIFWHCLTASLELTASRHWDEARQLAALHEVNIDRTLEPLPAVPEEENFLSHPFLQTCLREEPESFELISMHAASFIHGEIFRENLASLERGNPTRLKPILAKIDIDDLPKKTSGQSPAQILFQYTQELDIPWTELNALAGISTRSSLPPMGTVTATDDITPPLVTVARFDNLVDLIKVAELRFHALIILKKPEEARKCLLIQTRIAAAWLDDGTLAATSLGAAVTEKIVSQIHAGFAAKIWQTADVEWFAQWAAQTDLYVSLTKALRGEIRHEVRYIEGIRRDPGIPARNARFWLTDPKIYDQFPTEQREALAANADLPFDRDALAVFREFSELIYRSAPDSAFRLWKAAAVREQCVNHLDLPASGGLAAYAWPAEEKRKNLPPISPTETGALMVSAQTQVNLLRTACALYQWQLSKADYPPDLQSLIVQPGPESDLPAAAILDVCSGEPLIYQRISKKAYRLRSVGTDRTDDGGKSMVDGKGDLVWK